MEFRIAPFIILSLGIIVMLATLPEWHDSAMLYEQGRKFLIIEGIALFMGVSAYLRHDFYSRRERALFFGLLIIFLIFFIKYLYQYLSF